MAEKDWGQAHVNNTVGFGQGYINSTNGWGSIYPVSDSGITSLTAHRYLTHTLQQVLTTYKF